DAQEARVPSLPRRSAAAGSGGAPARLPPSRHDGPRAAGVGARRGPIYASGVNLLATPRSRGNVLPTGGSGRSTPVLVALVLSRQQVPGLLGGVRQVPGHAHHPEVRVPASQQRQAEPLGAAAVPAELA